MTVSINGTSGLVFNDASTQATAATGFGFKNRIINGAMMIDQRNAGASVTPSVLFNTYTLDRWNTSYSVASKFSVQQNAGSVTPPSGFTNYLGVTSTSAYTVGSGELFAVTQLIEGFNIADLGWGTANAQPVTLSFWVRSSLTGTFGGSFRNNDANRSYPYSYTISAANTWEQKTITVAGDTTGTWLTNNGVGIQIFFGLGVGSTRSGTAGAWAGSNFASATGATSVVGTSGATFYITGVQLEKGSTATSFDYRPYGTELNLCQRYLPMISCASSDGGQFAVGQASGTTAAEFHLRFPVTVRTAPTGLVIDTVSNLRCTNAAISGSPTVTSLGFLSGNSDSARFSAFVASGLVAGNATLLIPVGATKLYFTGCEL
jgi:hypothetical protein